jgi:parvulin-like peptidyl-prolyl isomerase
MTRRPPIRLLAHVLAISLALALGWGCSSLAVAAATVNGDKISESEVESEVNTLREDPIFGEALRRDPDTRGQRRREILGELIYQAVAAQEATKLNIKVTDKQIDSLIARSARSAGLSVKRFLDQENLSDAEAERLAERGVRRFALIDKVVKGAEVDDDAVREVYQGQRDRFVDVQLERITVKDGAAAREVLERLDDDESFSDIAKDVSTDDAADNGGDLGTVPITTLDVQVQSAVGQAVEGGVTDPIETEEGFEIYRLVERDTKSFREVSDEIRQSLVGSERDRLFDEWLVERVRRAKIVVNPKYGRFDKQALRPAVVPSSSELRP